MRLLRIGIIGAILASVLLAAAAQLILKIGMSSADVQQTLVGPDRSLVRTALAAATSPLVLTGLMLFGVSVLIWLYVLAQVEVSTAYSFVALGIVVTTLSGHFFLGEAFSPAKMAGTGMVVLGVLLLASGVVDAGPPR